MAEDLLDEKLIQVRDILRRAPKTDAGAIQKALGLPSAKLAEKYMQKALQLEQEVTEKIAAEGADVPIYRRHADGHLVKMKVVTQNDKRVVLIDDPQ